MNSQSAKAFRLISLLLTSFLGIVISTSVSAEHDRWKVRLRGIGIVPDDSSGPIVLNNTTALGVGVSVDEAFVPELDITYILTPHWGIEVIAGIANHDGVLLAGLGPTDGFKLFDTWVLPPTII